MRLQTPGQAAALSPEHQAVPVAIFSLFKYRAAFSAAQRWLRPSGSPRTGPESQHMESQRSSGCSELGQGGQNQTSGFVVCFSFPTADTVVCCCPLKCCPSAPRLLHSFSIGVVVLAPSSHPGSAFFLGLLFASQPDGFEAALQDTLQFKNHCYYFLQ